MNHSQYQVGVLVPLNDKSVEDESVPEVIIYEGDNVIGRGNIPLSDKRLSRKQLTLSASSDGPAEMVAEGTNPVVVHVGNERKILSLGDKVCLTNGDVIELIPGQYFFKFVRNEKHSVAKKDLGGLGVKRAEGEPNEAAAATSSQARLLQQEIYSHSKRQKVFGSRNTKEAISHFEVSNDKLPTTFRLMRVQGLPPQMNTSCVSIGDVIQGDVLVAVLSNYMVDIDWLLSACPKLKRVPHVMVIHGEADGTLEYMKRHKPANWILHKPPLPISYGTHHSKAMLLVYPRGVRVIVHTANLIYVDWNNKSQGLWMQDFPWKCPSDSGGSCGFESDVIDYLNALKLPELAASLPALGSVKINSSFFKKFNYGNAMVRLIASVPGYHSGLNLKKWGHMKLRSILEQCVFDKEFKEASLIYQFSSLGSLDEKWMVELKSSMSAGSSDDKSSLGIGEPFIIWPTVEDVRCSLEGYGAGNAIPSPLKNVEKAFLKKYLAKWKANHTGRCRAMPHIKTYTRFSGQNLAWFLLTSANLSKAAWGALQKNNTQLMIRSYEVCISGCIDVKRKRFSCFPPSHRNLCRMVSCL